MCGIAGLWDTRGVVGDAKTQLGAMLAAIAHRGPDDEGAFFDASHGVALGHRRLAILDLSAEGHQPMTSPSGRYVIVFNGEIYNYLDVRTELVSLGRSFRGHSDTEVALAAFETWGVDASVARFAGMFAFALWDSQDRTLTLARDRLGKKPLYYASRDGVLAFASQPAAIETLPALKGPLDRGALTLYMRTGYIPQPHAVWSNVRKLPPATLLTVGPEGPLSAPRAYWSVAGAVGAGLEKPLRVTEDEAVAELDRVLRIAVRERMLADVPLGAFLSGGVDSSTVVALMQAQSERPVKTFTIGFAESAYDEAPHAKAVAEHLGTEHTELYVTPEEAMAVIPRLARIYDEPFADSSQIPTFLVSQLARRHVTVALSGDGGDEIFGGYNRYLLAERAWRRLGPAPRFMRAGLALALLAVPIPWWDGAYKASLRVRGKRARVALAGDKAHKLAAVIGARDRDDLYRRIVSIWPDPERVVRGGREPDALLATARPVSDRFTERMMELDTVTYLPDDILAKVDRASMAVALEARAPLLDHRVLELAWRLPLELKVRAGEGKHILRRVLHQHVPKHLIERPKMGFGIPLDAWLRGPLRAWADALLDEKRLEREGLLDVAQVRRRWAEHTSGRRNWQAQLWTVLMLEQWLDAHPEALEAAA